MQPAMNTNPGLTPQMNHGGHEIYDVHEILEGAINVLDQYMLFRTFVQDNEFLGILVLR
ncbi:hypothetical protein [Paenibacillus pabuli]|uniref:hypothetical protein n=1 Tax=Paenibacillus pabuli TaxID=1472 RepID=UPI000AF7B7F8|nr:hypothetical protein [Paenibacillus pabuli]